MQLKRLIIAAALVAFAVPASADGFAEGERYTPPPSAKPAKPSKGAKPTKGEDPYAAHSRAPLKLAPYENSARNTGTQVWQIIDGEAEFLAPMPTPSRREPPATEVAVLAPVSGLPTVTGPSVYPQPVTRPSVVPDTTAFGSPAPDETLSASIPANAQDVPTLDPDRFNLTPISLYAEAATLDEIMSKLVPRAYSISYDVKPEKRNKTYKIIIEDTLKSAFKDLGERIGIDITTYHKAQVVLVTDRKDQ